MTTFPTGFQAAALAAGIKPSGKVDLTAVVSDRPCAWAFAGTTSAAAAACVTWGRERYATGAAVRALLVNAGNANAATGEGGARDNAEMAASLAALMGTAAEEVLTASTGVIGHRLPMDRVRSGVAALTNRFESDLSPHAHAIMTTDLVAKTAEATLSTGQRLVGVAKGSGMIHPNMATMFAFVYTDADVNQARLRAAFPGVVNRTFNAVTVDGDTSTNDMAVVLANGAGGACDETEFLTALEVVMRDLARQIARDGEGATKLLTVKVAGAASEEDALLAARTCAGSPLLKSAVHGNDPNWGRTIAALGRSGARLDLERLKVSVQGHRVFAGEPLPYDAKAVSGEMRAEEVVFDIDLGVGTASGEAWGCDLSAEYVRINAEYTT
ncbi:bifunctional glutamate N-acetyltransferase/amino-acid acetyltransferase ArgJ [Deinococcus yavapaiensis]|uniref:Arginine biosynthesis bifunctional protein ArgJ n=1 Tax=Deinococcus yavapaiensis KR-236 TaxID=694435 RepID=A0A318S6N4_9DEIO|nr:bifunctional glutamate N-acetyltransferase/amino-acid acetyltransferase ArgJ [Deinococcus yavapaiensis]PYE53377.1 glutamate N-acetyltransferase [Deinococcus yavapaiensis KR-236]